MATIEDLLAPRSSDPTAIRTAEVLHSTQDAAVVELIVDGTKALLSAVNWYDEVVLPQKHTRIQVTSDVTKEQGSIPTCTVRHPDMSALMLSSVAPAIREGLVQIVKTARMPGIRSKIVLAPTDADYKTSKTNPVREVLSPGASAVTYVSRALYGERIDLVPWCSDTAKLLKAALHPVNPSSIGIKGNDATVVVKPSDLSSAVGYRGSNSRLIGEITGYRVTFVPSD